MKGDFSRLEFDPRDNFTGVTHQQGRVLLDQDWNAADRIGRYQRQIQGRDTIGPDVAAAPSELPDSLKVVRARILEEDGERSVVVTLHPGRVWVDGLMLQVYETDPYERTLDYLPPPFHDTEMDVAGIIAGDRDAVILEVWEEPVNAFQDPIDLTEPALGGVDTIQRIKLSHCLRLLRLAPDDDCGNLKSRLQDDSDAKGRLTVIPAATLDIEGECPLEAGGGCTCFEHYLYRIEIADPNPTTGQARFKWSRFNGGLVGRGSFDSTVGEGRVTITANDQMINHCGLTGFYLEALQRRPDGRWTVALSARATLSEDGILDLTDVQGTWPEPPDPETDDAFFRLWDGMEAISGFANDDPAELPDHLGILVNFTPPDAHTYYLPGDYWTFPVRTAGVDFDPSVWPQEALPQGVHYHRAPLAVLNWDAPPTTEIEAPVGIGDCRVLFPPLTRLAGCCSLTVGDGVSSHGDCRSIGAAVGVPADDRRRDLCVTR